MRSRLIQALTLGVVLSLVATGCIVSRTVDRAFLGWTVRQPKYDDRKTAGVILLPFSFAVDVVTFPIQAILLAIFGDDFPFDDTKGVSALNDNPQFRNLPDDRKALALNEFRELVRSGSVTRNTALVLRGDGHWERVLITDEQRAQLYARSLATPVLSLASAH